MKLKMILRLVLLAALLSPAAAQEVRKLTLIEDRDQKYMCTRVFELKHVGAQDITPFILGAVKRFNSQSDVQRLHYPAGKTSFIVVSTGVDMMPYVVDMVAKLDRPSDIKDENSSLIDGDGIYRFVYYPKYRATTNMKDVLRLTVSDGDNFLDTSTNMFYWKDSKSDGEVQMKWLQALDRPVPQVNMHLNVYEVDESNFTELGVDYVSWKNGPGATLFGAGWDWSEFKQRFNLGPDTFSNFGPVTNSLGGFMVAPQFDATFLRMLSQKGKSRVATSGTLTVVNEFKTDPGDNNYDAAKFRLKFVPTLQNIVKDDNQNIRVDSLQETFYFYLRTPTIGSNDSGTKADTVMFGWVLRIESEKEKLNNGTPVIQQQFFRSRLTLSAGSEKILATYTKDHHVDQYNGMPFLGDIPGFKYLVGAAADSKTKSRIFITAAADPILPDTRVSQWAGKIIDTAEMLTKDDDKEAEKENAEPEKKSDKKKDNGNGAPKTAKAAKPAPKN